MNLLLLVRHKKPLQRVITTAQKLINYRLCSLDDQQIFHSENENILWDLCNPDILCLNCAAWADSSGPLEPKTNRLKSSFYANAKHTHFWFGQFIEC